MTEPLIPMSIMHKLVAYSSLLTTLSLAASGILFLLFGIFQRKWIDRVALFFLYFSLVPLLVMMCVGISCSGWSVLQQIYLDFGWGI